MMPSTRPNPVVMTRQTLEAYQRALMPGYGSGKASYGESPSPLSEADVRRIAEAVCDEQERRAIHPLRVTAADVRRWIPG